MTEPHERMINDAERENIRRILDHKIETDEDYSEIGRLAEDESIEKTNA